MGRYRAVQLGVVKKEVSSPRPSRLSSRRQFWRFEAKDLARGI